MLLLSLSFAQAQIVVNSTGDKPNAFPLITGVCSTDIIERECTLRAAIQLANFNPDVTTITFNIPTTDSGYNAQTNSWTINVGVNTGLPLDDLSTDINITGPDANVLTVQRDPVATSLRIFKITTATTVSISGLRIKDGIVTGYGGGIENTIGAAVNVNGCTFDGNTANNSRGGGLANASTGNVTLANCLLTQNVATYGGGGIANLSTGTITVTNSTLQGNIGADKGGGGIANLSTGTVMVTDCTLTANSGIGAGGGGVVNTGTMAITNSTISGNSHGGASGGFLISGQPSFGGGVKNSGRLTVTNTTLSGNSVRGGSSVTFSGGDGRGGGIYNSSIVDITNSTIYGNSTMLGDGSPSGKALGGGVYNETGAILTVTNSTITANTAADPGSGGGIFNVAFDGGHPPGVSSIRSTIIALNNGISGPDVAGPFTSGGFNLIGKQDGSTGFSQPTDHTGTAAVPLDPKLDPAGLKNNGGPTQTVAILPTSIAINNGAPDSPSADQRGVARVNVPDIGAFEFNGNFFPATLQNISTRGIVGIGDEVMIGGFIISGTGDKTVLLRAIGPSLSNPPVSLTGTLQDPTISLFNVSGKLISNDNWADASNAQSIDPGLRPANGLESAILISLAPGAYTAIVSGVGGGTGIGLVEVFDMDATVPSKLSNISTRGLVETGDNVLIGGLIVKGPESETVVVRAIGPSLAAPPINLTNVLQNPFLGLFNDQGSRIQFNDDWQSDQANDIIATGLQPSNPAESAIVRTLAPGNYTAIVSGVGGATGIALVEVYALD